jgi:pimeloyl-ACP methyl ester carboxylesterase
MLMGGYKRFTSLLLLAGWVLSNSSQAQNRLVTADLFPTLAADTGVGTGRIKPCLEQLAGTILCGRFRVYEDRKSRRGKAIDLAFIVAQATGPDRTRTDAISFFFGGPGASSTYLSATIIGSDRGEQLPQKRDLLFLDFRGVGHSQALFCDVPYPGGIESRFGSLFPIDHIKNCRDELAKNTKLEFYTSQHNMDDLDELRDWLDYESLNLIGGSYGSREIQVYLRRHSDKARAAVLNAVSPIFKGGYVTHARSLQDALDKLVEECARQTACSRSYPNFGHTLRRTLETVQSNPPQVVIDSLPVQFGPGEFGYALRGLLYGRATEIPHFVTQAANGHWQPLADYYINRTDWVGSRGGLVAAGMHFSVLCAEDVSQISRQDIERQTVGTFLGDHLIGGYKDVCDLWPYARLDPSFWKPVVSDVPTLFLSGNRDPVTPPTGAEAVAHHFSNSLHLVVENAGHGAGGPCVDAIQVQFINSGSVENLDTTCLVSRPANEFLSN